MVRRSERSRLQRTESSVAAHTAARESQSAGNKTEQAREEGDVPDWEQQRDSLMEGEAQCTGTRGKEGKAVDNLSMLTSY